MLYGEFVRKQMLISDILCIPIKRTHNTLSDRLLLAEPVNRHMACDGQQPCFSLLLPSNV